VIGLRTNNNVNFGRSAANLAAFGLCDAACDGDDGAGPIFAAQTANLGIDLLRCFFADVSWVEDDKIGIRLVIRRRHALAFEHLSHAFAIIDVHLAAVIFD
jgi:hypothetical protein